MGFAFLFGLVLGFGVLTVIPTPAFYTLIVAGLVVSQWPTVLFPFLVFGSARVVPTLLFAAKAGEARFRLTRESYEWTHLLDRLLVGVLAAISVVSLGGI